METLEKYLVNYLDLEMTEDCKEIELRTEDKKYIGTLYLYNDMGTRVEIHCDNYIADAKTVALLLKSNVIAARESTLRVYDEDSFFYEDFEEYTIYLRGIFSCDWNDIISGKNMTNYYKKKFNVDQKESIETFAKHCLNNCELVVVL